MCRKTAVNYIMYIHVQVTAHWFKCKKMKITPCTIHITQNHALLSTYFSYSNTRVKQ